MDNIKFSMYFGELTLNLFQNSCYFFYFYLVYKTPNN